MDIVGALEDTLHRILEHGDDSDVDVRAILGAYIPTPNQLQDNEFTYLDLCYVIPGLLTSFRKVVIVPKFISIVNTLGDLIRKGYLQIDPKDSNRLMIYRTNVINQDGDVSEGWYSQNILMLLMSCLMTKQVIKIW